MMLTNRKIANVINFYCSKTDSLLDFEHWYHTVKSIFGRLGVDPTHIGVTGKGFPKDIVTIEKIEKKLFNNKNSIEDLSVFYVKKSSDAPTYDWLIYCSLIKHLGGYDSILCFDEDFEAFGTGMFEEIASSLASINYFEYGIALQREFKKGPEFYGYGISQGLGSDPVSKLEHEKIAIWFRDRLNKNSFANGLLRDVYPYNYLNFKHLNYLVGKESFQDWIQNKSYRGELLKLNDLLTLWKVNKTNIDLIRKELNESSFLICYDPNVKITF